MTPTIPSYLWAKTDRENNALWHPLILHQLDVAACTDVILSCEPRKTRTLLAAVLGLEWDAARAWLLFLIACHDLGKACPGFQAKWSDHIPKLCLEMPPRPDTSVRHGFVGQYVLRGILQERNWPEELADLVSDAVGCHHGTRASEREKDLAFRGVQIGRGRQETLIRQQWMQARLSLVEALLKVFEPDAIPIKPNLSGPEFMLLAGLTSFADWIGSNEEWFPFGCPDDCLDLKGWFSRRRLLAEHALNRIGWEPRMPLAPVPKTFEEIFGFSPRPLQTTVAEILQRVEKPLVILVEAPMGEGKTEAAYYAHLELQRRCDHRGLYIALPTKATGNAMFGRTLDFLSRQGQERTLDLQLVHGATLINDAFQNLRFNGIHDPETGGEIRAGEWFTSKKRALLSEYGVGTVDQALLPILPVRHNFVRLWGLANRVVIFDEIHAYDAYTGTLLVHLLRWLLALGSSVVLLSATLPPSIRRKLAEISGAELPEKEADYPRLSMFQSGLVEQVHFDADPERRLRISLQGITPDLNAMREALDEKLASGGMGLALVNTVQRAQGLFLLYGSGETMKVRDTHVGKRLPDGTEVYLFHARFPADQRQRREDKVLQIFGINGDRSRRRILIATQVAEQSLDLDFDVMATDLAPIDLILQRAGRLWRHSRNKSGRGGISAPLLLIAGLSGEAPPSFGKPLWWNAVYREDILLSTWCLLRQRDELIVPDEIDPLVAEVYEGGVKVPDSLRDRFDDAAMKSTGESYALQNQADQAIIGFPDDESWNDPARFVMYDEDATGVHRTLTAQTRVGGDSVMAIPLRAEDGFNAQAVPDFMQSKQWFLRAVSLSRGHVVNNLRQIGVPEGWRQSALLRNCYPLELDDEGKWILNSTVRMDAELGVVYKTKEEK